jgi:serine/threonine protein kinase/tetratricopeptide (TPR) repeat protein
MLLQPGETFDRYVIEAAIGEGGMGRVYRARDTKLGRLVALKVLGSTPSGVSTEGLGRMMREARAAAAFDHPNAVALFDVGEFDGTPFIAMELVEGRSLRAYVGDAGISLTTRIRWLADIARALAAAHRRGLVHRDIKPENVMVREDGAVKVLDFGIARRTHSDQASPVTTLTAAGVVVGTPLYMAPEQIRAIAVDGRTDQFAWGVMAYELLAGELPWEAKSTGLGVVAQILTDDPMPLSDRVADLSSMIAATVMKAMSKSPDNRFPSMEDVVNAIDPHASAPSVTPSSIRIDGHDEISGPTIRSTPTAGPPPTKPSPEAQAPSKAAPPSERPPSAKPPSTQSPSSRMRQRRRRISTTMIAAVALAAGFGAMHLLANRAPATPEPAPAPSTAASAAPTAVTDLPLPSSAVPQALAEYREALQATRDAMSPEPHLVKALALDPSLAAAHLRLALLEQQPDPEDAAIHFRRASELRASLSPRDQGLLEALTPLMSRLDYAGTERAMADLRAKYPHDAELVLEHGVASNSVGDLKGSISEFAAAAALDPGYARAYWELGQEQAYQGDMDHARRTLDQCLSVAQAATDCHWTLDLLRESGGECAAITSDARAWTAADPQSEWAWEELARGLVATGAPVESAQEAVAQRIKQSAEPGRPRLEADWRVRSAVLGGRFDDAEQAAHDLEKIVASSSVALDHAMAARALVEVFRETGRLADAARVSSDYLKRRAGWTVTPTLEDSAVAADPVPVMLDAELRAGTIGRGAQMSQRDAWLADLNARAQPWVASYLWMHGVAAVAATPEEASAALEMLPRYEPLAPFRPRTVVDAGIGRMYALAGRPGEGLPLLRRGAATCLAFDLPIEWLRAQEWLGEALEKGGDTAGACGAYRTVLAHWGQAKPRSVTADAARSHAALLHCAE